jgi:hypothetical protein
LTGPNGFRPAWWLPGPHLQTIVASLCAGPDVPGSAERRFVRVSPGSTIRLDVNRPPAGARGTVLLVHGLGGSAESAHMRRSARHAIERGFAAVRMNLRNCGGTERLADSLYHAGQSDDVARAVEDLTRAEFPRPILLVGFSLGGNLVLLHAGRDGDACRADALVAINPPIELEACVRALEAPSNRLYQAYYVRKLRSLLERIAAVRDLGVSVPSAREIGTVRSFDERFTAPDGGFASASDYYERSSAAPVLGGVRRPALVLSAADDPFVPLAMFRRHDGNPRVRFVHPERGGHCGYWQSASPRFWAAEAALGFAGGEIAAASSTTTAAVSPLSPRRS